LNATLIAGSTKERKKLAMAFGSSKDFEANKDSINLEYYPEEVLEFAG